MDRAARLIRTVLVVALAVIGLLFAGRAAHAYGGVLKENIKTYGMQCPGGYGLPGQSGTSPGAVLGACQALLQGRYRETDLFGCRYREVYTWSLSFVDESPNGTWRYSSTRTASIVPLMTGCTPGTASPPSTGIDTASYSVQYTCPDHSSPVAGKANQCECSSGFLAKADNKCYQYTCGPSGSYSATVSPDVEVSTVGTQCINGCEVNPGSVKAGADGKLWAVWPFKSTGKFCSGAVDTTSGVSTGKTTGNDAPVPCGANMCPGSVNGVNVCVACRDTTVPGSSTAASAPDGSTTESKSETKCNQSECTTTTTTTTKDSSGAVTGTKTETKTEGQESFCKSNPDATVCKKSSFGGQCAATTCQGDAVQCAIAAEQYKRNCEWAQVDDAMKDIGTTAIGGGLRPSDHPAANADSKSVAFSTAIDQSDLIGFNCPTDRSIALGGAVYSIPFSRMCGNLQMVGQMMVAVCMLAAAFIVFKS